ncbi:golgin subfamily A member 2 [Rhagoletis pomonella]|uniref:golgin subfamily A member 2 n=1 Tax=Rhagoletis pomonella TaxID=28610 RepID=UPI00177F8A72|nr:golgin subfamily A member 2 [Rhagoletis pomonella]
MPVEEANESKAQKLAAARKKLKEYQKRAAVDNVASNVATASSTESHASSIAGGSISSNISEASDCDLSNNGHDSVNTNVASAVANIVTAENSGEPIAVTSIANENVVTAVPAVSSPAPPTAASYFQAPAAQGTPTTILDSFATQHGASTAVTAVKEVAANPVQPQNVNAIQVLITEKATLTTELNKYRCLCRERELEAEELRTQLDAITRRQDEVLNRYQTQQQNLEQLRSANAELQNKLAQANAKQEDQSAHLDELKRLLDVMQQRATDVEHQFKEKSNELEMAQLRIRQLSDEANINQDDNRIETLTQTQFMYEQQIRDLQAMVQQLTYDKEQANNQYQSYVQHLNAEISTLSEKNTELMDEYTKQQERERQLVDHISALEKDIQKNLSRQDQLKKEKEQATNQSTEKRNGEVEKLKEQINDFELERHEFQLKIKSQEDRLEKLNGELQEKQRKLEEMEEYMHNYAAEQPDKTKLLATMESDKIAASRALTQNVELKKQLDELELRFVQLTNDKADLVNKLDAEEHANREMRANYTEMEEQLRSIDERFKFKDEEMIRLSHENMELTNQAVELQKQLEYYLNHRTGSEDLASAGYHLEEFNKEDHIHEHRHEHGDHFDSDNETKENKHNGCDGEHEHEHYHDHAHGQSRAHEHRDDHEYTQHHQHQHEPKHVKKFSNSSSNTSTPHLPTDEAVGKLEKRFTRLMSQVADLTDEKQRLEHLVLQLQGETETIGEYITLYQTQRRMLKQREYEKAAQMQLLQREREQLRERIALLNNLVSSLSADLPQRMPITEHFNAIAVDSNANAAKDAEGVATTPLIAEASEALEEQQTQQQELCNPAEAQANEKLTASESRQILSKIQDIISEINENTQHIPDVAATQTADHLKCCLGKIEVV